MVPTIACGTLGSEQSHPVAGLDANASATGHGGKGNVAARQAQRLIRVARELGDRPERSQTPVRPRVGHLGGKKFEIARDVVHGGSRSNFPEYTSPDKNKADSYITGKRSCAVEPASRLRPAPG